MTEPQQPKRQPWSVDDLPVLTEVDEQPGEDAGGVEIPDFDFSDELEQMSQQLSSEADTGLEFPPELLLEEPASVAAQNEDVSLDFDQLPSLDLSAGDAEQGGAVADFEFELEPAAEPAKPVGLDALMARAMLETPQAEAGPAEEVSLADEIKELDLALDAAAEMPLPMLDVGAKKVPELDLALSEPATVAEPEIPELSAVADEAQIPELTSVAEEAQIPELTAVAEEAQIPELTAVAEEAQIPELTAVAEEAQIPELTAVAEEAQIPELTAVAEEAEIPELTAVAEEAQIPELTAVAEEAEIPELTAVAEEAEIPELTAVAEEAQIPELTAVAEEAEVPELTAVADEAQIPELTAVAEEAQIPELTAVAEEAQIPELTTVATEPEIPEQTAAEAVSADEAPELTPVASAAAVETLAATSDDPALAAAEAVTAAVTAPGAAVESLTAAAPCLSISLDSLPHGVLNGGMMLEPPAPPASPVSPVPVVSSSASMEDMIRAAEQTLAEELRKQALLRAQEEAAAAVASLTTAVAEVNASLPEAEPQAIAAEPMPTATEAIAEMPQAAPAVAEAGEPDEPVEAASLSQAMLEPAAMQPVAALSQPAEYRPVEIINVAGLASSPAPQSSMPPVRKSYVTLVDEAMLIDSLYHKILPRMKVELSLWLQDALDHQAKQMLSGVMHQLKEDYEMLFSETLRESLRQAIAEMGREDRGDRF